MERRTLALGGECWSKPDISHLSDELQQLSAVLASFMLT